MANLAFGPVDSGFGFLNCSCNEVVNTNNQKGYYFALALLALKSASINVTEEDLCIQQKYY